MGVETNTDKRINSVLFIKTASKPYRLKARSVTCSESVSPAMFMDVQIS